MQDLIRMSTKSLAYIYTYIYYLYHNATPMRITHTLSIL